MFPSSVRLTLAFALFALGTLLLSIGRGEGAFLIIAALYWLFTLIRYGSVLVAFKAYKRGDRRRMRELITGVWKPKLLAPRYRAYYHWLSGVIAYEDGRFDDARDAFVAAMRGRLWRESDRGLIAALLAEVEIRRGDLAAARAHIADARAADHTEDVERLLDELETEAGRDPGL